MLVGFVMQSKLTDGDRQSVQGLHISQIKVERNRGAREAFAFIFQMFWEPALSEEKLVLQH